MENFTLDDVEKAIKTFYYDDKNKQQAHSFLLSVSESRIAWEIAKQLLNKDKSVEIQFFASTMLTKKVRGGWDQFIQEEKESFCQYILQQAVEYSSSAHLVREQLITATAATLIRSLPFFPTCLIELFGIFNSHQELTKEHHGVRIIIISIIGRLPEEIENYKANFAVLKEAKEFLKKSLNDIVNLVDFILQQNNIDSKIIDLKKIAITCCLNWTNIDLNLEHLVRRPIFGILFACLNDNDPFNDLFEVAADLLSDVLTRRSITATGTPSFGSALKIAKKSLLQSSDPEVLCQVFSHILSTKTSFETSSDPDRIRSISLVVTGVCENNNFFFVTNQTNEVFLNLKVSLLQYLMQITSSEQMEISELALNCWSIFLKSIEYIQTSDWFKPVYDTLISVLWKKSYYPDQSQQNNILDLTDFLSYRESLSYCLSNIFVCMSQSYFEIIASKIQEAQTWKDVEASFFCFKIALTRLSEVENTSSLSPIIQHFIIKSVESLQQWPGVPHLLLTVIELIGKCSQWIPTALEGKQVSFCIEILLLNLTHANPEISYEATISIKQLCQNGPDFMFHYLQQLCNTLVSQYNNLVIKNKIILVTCISHVIFHVSNIPCDSACAMMQSINESIVSSILQNHHNFKQLEGELYCLAASINANVLTDLNIVDIGAITEAELILVPQPLTSNRVIVTHMRCYTTSNLINLLTQIQEKVLEVPLNNNNNNLHVIEAIAIVLRAILNNASKPLLTNEQVETTIIDILKFTVGGYLKYPTASTLLVIQHIIDNKLFEDNRICEVLVAVFEATFNLISSAQLCPSDILIGFFNLVNSAMTNMLHFFMINSSSQIIKSIFNSAIHCLVHSQDFAVQKCILTLIEFIISISNNNDFQTYVIEAYSDPNIGYNLCNQILNSIIVTNSNFRINELHISIFFRLLKQQQYQPISSFYFNEIFKNPEFLSAQCDLFTSENKAAILQILVQLPTLRKLKMFFQDVSGIANGTQTMDILLSYLM